MREFRDECVNPAIPQSFHIPVCIYFIWLNKKYQQLPAYSELSTVRVLGSDWRPGSLVVVGRVGSMPQAARVACLCKRPWTVRSRRFWLCGLDYVAFFLPLLRLFFFWGGVLEGLWCSSSFSSSSSSSSSSAGWSFPSWAMALASATRQTRNW